MNVGEQNSDGIGMRNSMKQQVCNVTGSTGSLSPNIFSDIPPTKNNTREPEKGLGNMALVGFHHSKRGDGRRIISPK